MNYEEISKSQDYMQACRDYLSEQYGEAVPLVMPSTVETLWNAILSGATEELAQLHILSDHRLQPPEKK